MHGLKTLILSNQKVKAFDEISSEAFQDLVDLQVLDLSSIGLTRVTNELFRKLKKLRSLKLAENRLENIDRLDFYLRAKLFIKI